MTKIECHGNCDYVEYPPAGFKFHKMFKHISPPQKIAKDVNKTDTNNVDNPPTWLKETYLFQ